MTEYPTKSAHIRALGATGLPVAAIAKAVGVRYQHVRNVLMDSGLIIPNKHAVVPRTPVPPKPPLTRKALLDAGFHIAGRWMNVNGDLAFEGDLPAAAGVYAFCDKDIAFYVGVATMGVAKRLYFYRKPAVTQTTSMRVKALLLEHLSSDSMDVLVAMAGLSEWNGLPVDLNAGLELGLIKGHHLKWNKRGL